MTDAEHFFEAITLIDLTVALTSTRSMFSSDEVQNLLLDIRQHITRRDYHSN